MAPSGSDPSVRIFGIRHHGPGSARNLVAALKAFAPDGILIEGPVEASDLIAMTANPKMKPPVALLVYVPDRPQCSGFYPFAVFSPEWQAMQYALKNNLPVRFMDLPQQNWLALNPAAEEESLIPILPAEGEAAAAPAAEPEPEAPAASVDSTACEADGGEAVDLMTIAADPLDLLAKVAGAESGEIWWGQLVEEHKEEPELFPAILEAMGALRMLDKDGIPTADPRDPVEPLREASMRTIIRAAQKEGWQRIAVVCGAWHAPALVPLTRTVKSDRDLLKGLAKVKVEATWVPWSYGHLARESGYGAGILSPGWYEHLWRTPQHTAVKWLGRVAKLLRHEDLDASAAQVIDAVRLSEALAAIRGLARPGLTELNEAVLTVFCFGNAVPLKVIEKQMIVGEKLGEVPADTPGVPLQADLAALQKKLRMLPKPEAETKDLDLREPMDLARSTLLHRLKLLEIPWGKPGRSGGGKGTFHEIWTLKWDPAFSVALVDASHWGNTVATAALGLATFKAENAPNLGFLTGLLDQVLLADLPKAVGPVMTGIQARMARSGDVAGLMDAIPPLARAMRYGTVRQTSGTAQFDFKAFNEILDGMVTRICIGLPLACASLDDAAADAMLSLIESTQESLDLLQNESWLTSWRQVLLRLADQGGLHGLIAGRCTRMLFDVGMLDAEEVAKRLGLALSPGNGPEASATWLAGLLRGSGLLLLHDAKLWSILDGWVRDLSADHFITVLPLLRRAFSAFTPPERRQMGELVVRGVKKSHGPADLAVDEERANAVLPQLARLLGLSLNE